MADVPRYWNLERYPGKYVAIDMKTDQVVLIADSRISSMTTSENAGLRNVMVMRAPMEDDPLFVGPG